MTDEQAGYYWDRGESKNPFIGRWQWRLGVSGGGARTEDEAIRQLKIMGATTTTNVTTEGREKEFGHHEQQP